MDMQLEALQIRSGDRILFGGLALGLALLLAPAGVRAQAVAASAQAAAAPAEQTLGLKDCLETALKKNHARPASRFAIEMAEAQHRQALSGYWPQLSAQGGVERMQHAPYFIFPASEEGIPAQTISAPASSMLITIPAGAFGPGFPPKDVQLPIAVPSEKISVPAQVFSVPEQKIKLMDPTLETISGKADWLLWDGGMRRGLADQASAGVDAAKAESHRTDLEIRESVTRIYWGAVLARQLLGLGQDTLERMNATLQITESLYQAGTGTVTKADYLDNKVMVETVRSLVAELEKNDKAARAALAYTMGLEWDQTVNPADEEIPYAASTAKLGDLVATAYEFNPDWEKLAAGLKAYEGERKTAMSGHAPKLALTGALHRYWNDYSVALTNSSNMQGWTVGAGVEIPVFDGFLTSGRVAEAQAKLNRLKEQKILLHEGLGLELRQMFIGLEASEKAHDAAKAAWDAAKEDNDLTTRGYSAGLLATEKVIRAQIQEALIASSYFKTNYDHAALQAQIDMTVGKQVEAAVEAAH